MTCGISLATKGARRARQITHGHEVKWEESPGAVSFVPADDEDHTYLITSDDGCELFVALIPQRHLKRVTAAEGVLASTEWSPLLASRDAVVSDCMARLAFASKVNDSAMDVGMDEVARRLVLRLTYLNGDGTPDWLGDASVFDARTLLGLVAHVDEHLRIAPSLSDMASLVGSSPSHFARKFRRSTGLSLHRFINRSRILRSLETLKTDSSVAEPLHPSLRRPHRHDAREVSETVQACRGVMRQEVVHGPRVTPGPPSRRHRGSLRMIFAQ